MTEAQLIDAALAGDQDAFTELYKTHIKYVRAVCFAILKSDDIEDTCQDVFARAFTRLDTFHRGCKLRTWITRIAMNSCLMELRTRRQPSNGSDRLVDIAALDTTESVLDDTVFVENDRGFGAVEAKLDLPKLMACVQPENRMLLEMAYIQELADQDIADQTGLTLPAVKSRLHNAKRKMRENMTGVHATRKVKVHL